MFNEQTVNKFKLVLYPILLILGVILGWYLKPEAVRVEEKLKVVELEKQVVVEKEKLKVEIIHVKDTQVVERWRREKTETQLPDGTITKRETEEKNIDTVVKEKTTDTKVVEVEKQVVIEVEKFVDRKVLIEPKLENWGVNVLAGVQPKLNPLSTDLVLGVQAERRVAGPFWAGIWVQTVTPTNFSNLNAIQGGLQVGAKF